MWRLLGDRSDAGTVAELVVAGKVRKTRFAHHQREVDRSAPNPESILLRPNAMDVGL